jgi:hypothetical protein
MKALKIILYSVAGLVLLFVVLGLFGPKTYHFERSKVVNAPADIIWEELSHFNNWPKWSPWQEKDPGVKNTYEGTDGTVGAVMKWEGDKKKTGTGQMVITALEPNKKISYDLSFIVPWTMSSKGYFALEEDANKQTKVTWADEGNIPFIQRPMMFFASMDKFLGPDFERGLVKIDSLAAISSAQLKAEGEAKSQMQQEEAAMDSISSPEKVK